MTQTYREIVSRIQNNLNTLNKDMFIPRRFILSVFKSKAEFLMAQKFYDKSLFRETNLYDWIECIDMEKVDTITCGKLELKTCNVVSRSKKPLPKLIWTKYGSTVLMVTNIDNSKEYKLVTQSYYNNIRKKSLFEKFKGKYAIIYPDNRIVIPDSNVKKINVLMYSLDESSVNCSSCEESDNCKSYWDKQITLSDKVSEIAISETLKEISMRIQIPKDENPNGDSNIKTREQQ